MKKITFTKTLIIAGLTLAMSSPAWSQKVMKIATWLSPKHTQNMAVFGTWKKELEAATDGRVTLKLEYGLGHPKSLFDLAEDGAVDAAWSYNGYMPGRFDLTGYAELPLYKKVDAERVSLALWDTYDKHLKSEGEYDGLYLAGMWVHPLGQIHLRKPIASLTELKGMKIRIGGGIQKAIADSFGVVGVAAPGSKVYEILQQGVADGVFMPAASQEELRLKEVAPYLIETDMYYGVFSFVINEDFMDSLGADRAAVEKITGRHFAQLAGQKWQIGSSDALAKAKNVIRSNKMQMEFKNGTGHVEKEWLDKASKKSDKAETALREFQATLK